MSLIRWELDPEQFQLNFTSRLTEASMNPVTELIMDVLMEHLENSLKDQVSKGDILDYKLKYSYPTVSGFGLPESLKVLVQRPDIVLGNFSVTVTSGTPDAEGVIFQMASNITWHTSETKRLALKTRTKSTVKVNDLSLQSQVIRHLVNSLNTPCDCRPECLVPYISGVWEWYLRFVCRVCGKTYFCECFRTAFQKHYFEAMEAKDHYGEGGWPHKFLALYKEVSFRDCICHLCRNIPSEVFYCNPMYGSSVMVHYGPYIARTAIEKGIDEREAENEIRQLVGVPRIGEGWVSEMELLNVIRASFPGYEVVHQASPAWLGRQRLDVFIPQLNVAVEYQDAQHYEPVRLFGGEEGFVKTQQRDSLKASLCRQNGVTLIYFRHDELINRRGVESKIKNAIVNRGVV